MSSLEQLRALSTLGRRDLERAAAELLGVRADVERVEAEVQVAAQRVARERDKIAAEAEDADAASTAGDLALGAAFRALARERIRKLDADLAAARGALERLRSAERGHQDAVRSALGRCQGLDARIRREILVELSVAEQRDDEDAADARVQGGRRRVG